MPVLFSELDNRWTPTPLAAAGGPFPAFGRRTRLVSFAEGPARAIVLLAEPGQAVFVNGEPLIGHLRVLSHKDELLIAGARYFYSAESQPVLEVFRLDAGQRRPRCPVCRMAIEDGQSAVWCPGCGRVYHEMSAEAEQPAKNCWTYNARCRFCEHPTDVGGDRLWTPAVGEEACDA